MVTPRSRIAEILGAYAIVGAEDVPTRWNRALAAVDGAINLVPGYIVDRYPAVQQAKATRDQLYAGYARAASSHDDRLASLATIAMENLAAKLAGTSYPSLAALEKSYEKNLTDAGLVDAVQKVNRAAGAAPAAAAEPLDMIEWIKSHPILAAAIGGVVLLVGGGAVFAVIRR